MPNAVIVVVPVIVTASPVAVARSVVDAEAMFDDWTVRLSLAATEVVAAVPPLVIATVEIGCPSIGVYFKQRQFPDPRESICATSPTAQEMFAPYSKIKDVALCVRIGTPVNVSVRFAPAATVLNEVIVADPVIVTASPVAKDRSVVGFAAMLED